MVALEAAGANQTACELSWYWYWLVFKVEKRAPTNELSIIYVSKDNDGKETNVENVMNWEL
jgi:hypothetical protein